MDNAFDTVRLTFSSMNSIIEQYIWHIWTMITIIIQLNNHHKSTNMSRQLLHKFRSHPSSINKFKLVLLCLKLIERIFWQKIAILLINSSILQAMQQLLPPKLKLSSNPHKVKFKYIQKFSLQDKSSP